MPPVLCVDFGSAYTKVALRPDEDSPADVVQERALAFDDEMFCVPSVVAGPVGDWSRLSCGLNAVGLKDTAEVKVYRNWKRQLLAAPEPAESRDRVAMFLSRLEEQSRHRHLFEDLASAHRLDSAIVWGVAREMGLSEGELEESVARTKPAFVPGGCDLHLDRAPERNGARRRKSRTNLDSETHAVAVAYFSWLREFLAPVLRERGVADVSTVAVRVCVPAFDRSLGVRPEGELLEVLREAGWSPHDRCAVLSEPLANAVGVLTGGVNSTLQLRPGAERTINLGKMFRGGPVQRALRGGKDGTVRVLAVDVGAYTADFALVTFRRDGLEVAHEVTSRSEPLGITELDVRVRDVLPTFASQWLATRDVRRQEAFRRSVYGGVDRPVKLSEKESVTRAQVAEIQGVIRTFGGEIAARAEATLGRDAERIDELILTGGGSNVTALRETLRQRLGGRGAEVVHMPSPASAASPGLRPLGQKLVRGGSALGGASIYVDYQLR
jgi:hypothetical protein